MTALVSNPRTLLALMAAGAGLGRSIQTPVHRLPLDAFSHATSLGEACARLEGRSVLLFVGDMAKAAAALIELDGLAGRIVLCPPGLEPAHLGALVRDAEVDAIVHDSDAPAPDCGVWMCVACTLPLKPLQRPRVNRRRTEWALLTSGTSGGPKMVAHDLDDLMSAIPPAPKQSWGTFYDVRRYGGLQIFLRALSGIGSLTLTGEHEPIETFLARLGAAQATHISGTPSHWRLALLSGAANLIDPDYIRLSGEIADQTILDALRAAFARARIVHAFASTEVGVAFAIEDGLAGFPAALIDASGEPSFKIIDGSLRIRSRGAASRYLGRDLLSLSDADGFVDTGDMVERRGERFYFLGRRGGVINVGGAKVHPEEVEAVINAHSHVRASRVFGRKNRLTGALVAAEVVLSEPAADQKETAREIRALCSAKLAAYKVPFSILFVGELPVTDGGKIARSV